jgi:hypothetical protein
VTSIELPISEGRLPIFLRRSIVSPKIANRKYFLPIWVFSDLQPDRLALASCLLLL